MKLLRSIETITTEQILKIIGTFNVIVFCGGMVGGLLLGLLFSFNSFSEDIKGVLAGFDAILLLIFLIIANRYIDRKITPELRKRCKDNLLSARLTGAP